MVGGGECVEEGYVGGEVAAGAGEVACTESGGEFLRGGIEAEGEYQGLRHG